MRMAWTWRGTALGFTAVVLSACAPAVPRTEPIKPIGGGEAFGGVQCSAVRPQTEPDLMAWDPGSRANLNRLRTRGVVAVRYEAKGCNVELELLSHCIGGGGKYEFSPYSANEHKVARNASELFAELPVGAARLAGKVKGDRALRTDYMMAGQYALPPDATFRRGDLRGADCARATHVVSAVYVGAFAMGAGESRAMEARASLLGVGSAGGAAEANVELLAEEGEVKACDQAQEGGKADDRCSVPLRVGLLPLSAETQPAAPIPAVQPKAAAAAVEPKRVAPAPGGSEPALQPCPTAFRRDAASGACVDNEDIVWKVPVDDSPVRGPSDALVTIVEFGGYQCRFTKRGEATLTELRRIYGNKLRFVWKDMPLPFHERSKPAANLARSALAQRGAPAFWNVHDALFASAPNLDDADLEVIARQAGLDVSRAMTEARTGKYQGAIERDAGLGKDVAANGTPTFFINGHRLGGAKPIDAFQRLVERSLQEAQALLARGVAPGAVYSTIQKNGVILPPKAN